MSYDVTEIQPVSTDVTSSQCVSEESADRVERYLEQQYDINLSPVTDADGTVILVDDQNNPVAEIRPEDGLVLNHVDGSVMCADDISEEDIDSGPTTEEIIKSLQDFFNGGSSDDSALNPDSSTSQNNSAAKYSDKSESYTSKLSDSLDCDTDDGVKKVSDLIDDSDPVDTDYASSGADDLSFGSQPVEGAASVAGQPAMTEPAGAMVGSMPPFEAPKVDAPVVGAAHMVSPSDSLGSADVVAETKASVVNPHETVNASHDGVASTLVAGGAMLTCEGKKKDEGGVASYVVASSVDLSESEPEVEKFGARDSKKEVSHKKSSSDGSGVDSSSSAVANFSAPAPKSAKSSSPFDVGSKVVFDQNADPFAIACAHANKGGPPYLNYLAVPVAAVTVGDGDKTGMHHVVAAHQRDGHQDRQDDRGEGGGQDRDPESEEEEGSVASVA